MCKNHDRLHYRRFAREVAAILAGPGNEETRDLLLARATVEGLDAASRLPGLELPPQDAARVRSRLAAERAALAELAEQRLAQHVRDALAQAFDEPPF